MLVLILVAALWAGMHDAPYNGPEARDGRPNTGFQEHARKW